MLNKLFDFDKKRVVIGVIGMVLSIAAAVVFGTLDTPGALAELSPLGLTYRILFVTALSLVIGFLMFMLGGAKMFLFGFGVYEACAAISIAVNYGTDTGMMIGGFALVGVLVAVAWIFTVISYKSYKREINADEEAERLTDEMVSAAGTNLFGDDDEKQKSAIKYLEKSAVLSTSLSGVYQVVKISEGYYFKYIGNNTVKSLDMSKFVTDFDNMIVEQNNKNFVIRYSDIENMTATVKPDADMRAIAFRDFGSIKFKLAGGGKKTFQFVCVLTEEEVKHFFGAVEVKVKRRRLTESKRGDLSEKQKSALNKCNKGMFIYSFISVPIYVFYFLFNTVKTAPYLTPVCLAIALVPFVLYAAFPKYFTMRNSNGVTDVVDGKLSIWYSSILPSLILGLKCLYAGQYVFDYDILELFLISLGVLAVLYAVMLLVTREYRKYKSCIATMAIGLLVFSPSAVYLVNRSFDFAEPREVNCEIIEKYTFTAKNGDMSYYFVLDFEGKEKKSEIEQKCYESFDEGDFVVVKKYHGALGIAYTYYDDEI